MSGTVAEKNQVILMLLKARERCSGTWFDRITHPATARTRAMMLDELVNWKLAKPMSMPSSRW